jgi:hypothetical protein
LNKRASIFFSFNKYLLNNYQATHFPNAEDTHVKKHNKKYLLFKSVYASKINTTNFTESHRASLLGHLTLFYLSHEAGPLTILFFTDEEAVIQRG